MFIEPYRSDSSLYFFVFFVISLIQIGILIVWAIGIPGWYSVYVHFRTLDF